MVESDYGKMAYVKVCELEKKLKNLESLYSEVKYNEVNFSFKENANKNCYEKTFKVNAVKDGKYTFKGSVEIDVALQNGVSVLVYVNGVLAYSNKNLNLTNFSYDFEAVLSKGENQIKTTCQAEESYNLISLNYTVCGYIDYVKSNNALSRISYNGYDFILHLLDDKAFLYKYSALNGLILNGEFSSLFQASIIGVDSNCVYLAAIDSSKFLRVISYDYNNNVIVNNVALNVGGVLSVCGYMFGDTFKLYFTRLLEVCCGDFSFSNEFTYYRTGRKGAKVYLEPNETNYLIISDKYSNAKLVSI
jgi:hypothetical protein